MNRKICVFRMGFLWHLLPPLPEFLRGLSARGCEVTLIKSYPRNRSMPEELLPEIRNSMMELHARKLPKSRFLEPLVFLEFTLKCVWRGIFARPDVIIAVDIDSLLAGYIASRLTGSRLVYYSLELYTERPNITGKRFWLALEKLLIGKPDLLVTCEPNRGRVMVEKYGAPETPLCVLNVPAFRERVRTTVLRDYLSAKGVSFNRVVLYQGGIGPTRCVEEIIQASALLPEGVVTAFVGRMSPSYNFDEGVRRHRAEGKAFYYGCVETLDDLREVTQSADLGLQLQFNLGLNAFYCAPGKMFQYLMAGLPVVASNFPGMLEIVEGDDVGLCVNPESPKEIAEAITQILSDEAVYERMSKNALKAAKEKYCFEVEGAKLLDAVVSLEKRS
jgi:glycosyltransferase involved in cell wall biosynthesis